MKRIVVLVVMLLVFALTVPASAATWRNVGSTKGVGRSYAPAWVGMIGQASNVKKARIGIYNGDTRSRSIQTSRYVSCTNSNYNYTSGSKNASHSVAAKSWKWVTIFSRTNSWDHCEIDVDAYNFNLRGPLRLRVQVQ
ncbi:MAG TPA: hypothetical protein VFZ70_16020 [Euzebyales bacterium]